MPLTIDLKTADKRTVERYIKLGLVDEKEYEKHLKSLPDLAEKAAVVETRMDEDLDDELEDEDEDDAEADGVDEGS